MTSSVWTDDSIALTEKIIHIQDMLISALGLCLHRGINTRNYGLIIKLLPTIERNTEILERAARDLMALKRAGQGRPPLWFELAENVLYFSLQTERALAKIRREIDGNYWKLIGTRLEGCLRDCRKLQREILIIAPHELDSDIVQNVTNLLDTLEMGTTTGGRWRKRYAQMEKENQEPLLDNERDEEGRETKRK